MLDPLTQGVGQVFSGPKSLVGAPVPGLYCGVIKVFLVDDHEVVRRGLAELLTSDPTSRSSASGHLHRGPRPHSRGPPDVAVLDIRLPDGSGIDLCRELLATNDELCC